MIDKIVDINVLSPCVVTGVAFKKYYSSLQLLNRVNEFIEEMPNIHVDTHYTVETETGLTCIVMINSKCEIPEELISVILLDAGYNSILRRCEYRTFDNIHELDTCVRQLSLTPDMLMAIAIDNSSDDLFVMARYDAPAAICEYGEPCDPDILSTSCTDITRQYKMYMTEVLLNEKEDNHST